MMQPTSKQHKILALFLLLLLGFVIFLVVMLYSALHQRAVPSLFSEQTLQARRGSIMSRDGFHVVTTQKRYKVMVNTRNIDPKKRELFIQLFSIYSSIPSSTIRRQLATHRGNVILSYSIGTKEAMYLQSLASELRRLKVFIEYENSHGDMILQGLSILASGEGRVYAYGRTLSPLLGYTQKREVDGYTRTYGVKGIEKLYDNTLSPHRDETKKARRDVNGYLILNKESQATLPINGSDIQLTIPLALQARTEVILDRMRARLQAKEIIAIILDSRTGEVLSLASSNRFNPGNIHRSDYASLNVNAIEYTFEPGSVIKPIIFSLLLEQGKISPTELVNVHWGRHRISNKVITDEHRMGLISAEDVIVHSSNIGIAQLAQRFDNYRYAEGLAKFGLGNLSGIELPYEKRGSLPSASRLRSPLYKAISAYGYGLRTNTLQLAKAYNVFNNGGKIINPSLIHAFYDPYNRTHHSHRPRALQVISPQSAHIMKEILIKTVQKGTATAAKTEGLEIGGKTGTAHIVKNGRYVNSYHASFIGFANDTQRRYTIAIMVAEPRTAYFAAVAAVPTFKAIIDMMINQHYLTPQKAPKEP